MSSERINDKTVINHGNRNTKNSCNNHFVRFKKKKHRAYVEPTRLTRTDALSQPDRTVIEVEAVGAVGDTRVGALVQVEPGPARGALVATATDARLAQRRALLAALPVIPEEAAGALGHTHPARDTGRGERRGGGREGERVKEGERGHEVK